MGKETREYYDFGFGYIELIIVNGGFVWGKKQSSMIFGFCYVHLIIVNT